jgi:pimeloyl-ACP methyl ester carboxylesterase
MPDTEIATAKRAAIATVDDILIGFLADQRQRLAPLPTAIRIEPARAMPSRTARITPTRSVARCLLSAQAYLGYAVSKQLAQVAGDVRGAVIPASGHNVALENPAALGRAYLDFFAEG